FDRQLRGPAAVDRAFVTITLLTTGALVGEAAIFGAGLGQLLERYTFYTVPLIGIRFLLAVETRLLTPRTHLLLAGVLLAGTLLVPLDDLLFTGTRDQSPTMAAVSTVGRHVGWAAPLVVGAVLCLLVLGTIAAGRRGDRAAPIVLAA